MWDPVVNLFRSRTFVSALVGAIFSVIIVAVPTLAPYVDTFIPLIIVFVLAIAGGEVVETAGKASVNTEKERTTQAQYAMQTAQYQADAARVQSASMSRG